jgi:ribonuclease P protein component
MAHLFGRHVRLRNRAEFTVVQQSGRRVATRSMTVLGLVNARETDRLGIIASRRLGSAVVRNGAKRRLRELFRHQEAVRELRANQPSLDLVVIPRREFTATPFATLRIEFQAAVRRLRGSH